MAVAGRKPQPTSLKILKGETRKERLNKDEPKPQPIAPPKPEYLNEHASAMWDRLAPKLVRMGLLTEVDGESFTSLCQAYGAWVQCQIEINEGGIDMKVGKGEYRQVKPIVSESHKYFSEVKALLAEFGLTPSARARLSVKPDAGDEFEDLI